MSKRIEDVLRKAGGQTIGSETTRQLGEVDESLRDRLGVTEGFGRDVDTGEAVLGLGKVATKAAKLVKDQFDRASAAKIIDKSRESLTKKLDEIDKLPPKDQFGELQKLAVDIDDLDGELGYMSETVRKDVINAYKNEFRGRMQNKVKSAMALFTTSAQNKIQEGIDIAVNSAIENPNQDPSAALAAVNTDINNFAMNDTQKEIMKNKAMAELYTGIARGHRGREDRKALRSALSSKEFKDNLPKAEYARLYAYANNEPGGPASESILSKGFRAALVNGDLSSVAEAVSQLDDSKPMKKAGGALLHTMTANVGSRSGLISKPELNKILSTKGITSVQRAAILSGISKLNDYHRKDPNMFRKAHDPEYFKATEEEWYKKYGVGKATNAEAASIGMQLVEVSSSKIKGKGNPFKQRILDIRQEADFDATVYGANLDRYLQTAKQQMVRAGVPKKVADAKIGVTSLLAQFSNDELGFINVAQAQRATDKPKVIKFMPDVEKLESLITREDLKLIRSMPNSDDTLAALGVLSTDAAIIKLESQNKPITDSGAAWETIDNHIRVEAKAYINKIRSASLAVEASKGKFGNMAQVKNRHGHPIVFPKAVLDSESNAANLRTWTRSMQPLSLRKLSEGTEMFDATTNERLSDGRTESYIEPIKGGQGYRLMLRTLDPASGKYLSPGPARRRDGSLLEWSKYEIVKGRTGLTPKAK